MMRAATSGGRDGGFTLIEMIIAMVLLAVAFAAIVPAILNTRDSASRQSAVSQADGDVKLAAKLFERDVRGARGTRSTGDRNGVGSMGTASTAGSLGQSINGTAHDVVVAEPNLLVLYTDAIAEPAGTLPVPERVTWQRLANNATCGTRSRTTNANWCIVRTVQGATTTSEVLVAARGTTPRSTSCFPAGTVSVPQDRTFCYEMVTPQNGYVWNTWSANCSAAWQTTTGAIGRGSITTRPNAVDTFPINNLDRIVTIGAALQSGGAYGRAAERSYEGTQASIRSRESPSYREAIMCGSRMGWFR